MQMRSLIGSSFLILGAGIAAAACGSDDAAVDTTTFDGGLADANGGGGGSSTPSTGGSSSRPEPACDLSACETPDVGGLEVMGFDVSSFLSPCCTPDGGCGIDTSIAAAAGLPDMGCVDPDEFLGGDGGLFGGGGSIEILDGGVILVPDGDPILLDDSCSGITMSNPLMPLELPGCCTPAGVCGGSTHTVQDLPLVGDMVPLQCATHDDVDEFIAESGFGQFINAPADPGETCTYQLPGDDPEPDAGAPDAGEPDAGETPDEDSGSPDPVDGGDADGAADGGSDAD